MDPDELVYALNEIRTGSIIVAQDMTPMLAKVLRNELTDSEPSLAVFYKIVKLAKNGALMIIHIYAKVSQ
jgi:hypothetical protein